jgi:hypothetical protein
VSKYGTLRRNGRRRAGVLSEGEFERKKSRGRERGVRERGKYGKEGRDEK